LPESLKLVHYQFLALVQGNISIGGGLGPPGPTFWRQQN